MALNTIQRIALTPGESAGIGPDLCIQLAQQDLPCQLIAIASPELLVQRAKQLGLSIRINEFDSSLPPTTQTAGCMTVLPVELAEPAQCGQTNPLNSRYVLKTITKAVKGCLDGLFDAMVTGPVHKGIINDAGFTFSGHTEYIAGITGGHPVMMLATPGLRVALVTTHLPLAEVSRPLRIRACVLSFVYSIMICVHAFTLITQKYWCADSILMPEKTATWAVKKSILSNRYWKA